MEYLPGTCNIGPEEIVRRKRNGWIGLLVTVVLGVTIELAGWPRAYRLLVIPTLAYALAGFIQGYHRFCLAYGFLGLFGMHGVRQVSRVTDREALRQDRRKALQITLWMLSGTAILTICYYLMP